MYISPTPEAIQALMQSGISGEVLMLNLMKFRDIADYSENPDLAPSEEISGQAAYDVYGTYVLPMALDVGAEVVAMGEADGFLIGPEDETWDRMLLVRYPNLQAFVALTQDPKYHEVAGHRTAALADSRLLPLT